MRQADIEMLNDLFVQVAQAHENAKLATARYNEHRERCDHNYPNGDTALCVSQRFGDACCRICHTWVRAK